MARKHLKIVQTTIDLDGRVKDAIVILRQFLDLDPEATIEHEWYEEISDRYYVQYMRPMTESEIAKADKEARRARERDKKTRERVEEREREELGKLAKKFGLKLVEESQ